MHLASSGKPCLTICQAYICFAHQIIDAALLILFFFLFSQPFRNVRRWLSTRPSMQYMQYSEEKDATEKLRSPAPFPQTLLSFLSLFQLSLGQKKEKRKKERGNLGFSRSKKRKTDWTRLTLLRELRTSLIPRDINGR